MRTVATPDYLVFWCHDTERERHPWTQEIFYYCSQATKDNDKEETTLELPKNSRRLATWDTQWGTYIDLGSDSAPCTVYPIIQIKKHPHNCLSIMTTNNPILSRKSNTPPLEIGLNLTKESFGIFPTANCRLDIWRRMPPLPPALDLCTHIDRLKVSICFGRERRKANKRTWSQRRPSPLRYSAFFESWSADPRRHIYLGQPYFWVIVCQMCVGRSVTCATYYRLVQTCDLNH